MKGVTVPGSNSSTAKHSGSGLGLGKISEGPEQPGLRGSPIFSIFLLMVIEEEVLMMEVVLTENILMKCIEEGCDGGGAVFGGGRGRGRGLVDGVDDGA